MIKINHLTKLFDKRMAVDKVSFEVGEGETLVLLGTSGCGKTTTLRMLNRLIEPDSGTIEINGANIRDSQPHELRRQIGYVIQETGLFPHYTIGENIAVVPKLLHWETEKVRKRTLELLAMLRLPESCLNQYPDQLSGGQRQRVGLARALAANPPIVLMDEPLGALDPITRVSIRREFQQLEELQKKTIILVTHDIQEAFDLGDRICLMDQGRIQQIGTPKELLLKPANAFVTAFLSDQRFALQLRIFTLQDLCSFLLPVGVANAQANLFRLEPQTTLSDALGHFSQENEIGFQVDGHGYQVGFEGMMAAFYRVVKA